MRLWGGAMVLMREKFVLHSKLNLVIPNGYFGLAYWGVAGNKLFQNRNNSPVLATKEKVD